MIPKILIFSNEILGRSLALPANGLDGVKGNISFGGAFCLAKFILKFRRKKESSQQGRGGMCATGEYPLAQIRKIINSLALVGKKGKMRLPS